MIEDVGAIQLDFSVDTPACASLSPPDDEAALVERAQSVPEAFGRLFELHYQKILDYAFRSTLNPAVAEELTSNTFFKAFRSLKKYRRRCRFSAWLYGIATNEIRMHWRSEARRRRAVAAWANALEADRVYFEAPAVETDETLREKMEQCRRLHDLIGRLPERYRTVILLRYFENLTYEMIAEALGKRLGTVKSLHHRAVKRLKKISDRDATFRLRRHSD
jgi:RNA polymerase sigma factor (sigma-70 family)